MGYPRETIEFVEVPVTVDGTPAVPTSIALVNTGRPGDDDNPWQDPYELEGKYGVLLDGTLPAKGYSVYVRVSDSPETPVIKAGRITID